MSGLRWFAKRRGVVISANGFGKAKTGLQVVTDRDPHLSPIRPWWRSQLLVAVTTVVTILSGMSYFISYAGERPGRAGLLAGLMPRADPLPSRPAGAPRSGLRGSPPLGLLRRHRDHP